MKDIPRVSLGVIILKDDKVLLGLRKGSYGEGTRAFPGGHLEFMESFEECAKRETLEETNLKIKNVELVTVTDYYPEKNKHYVTIFMKSEFDSGELINMEPERCEELKWYGINELPSPLIQPIQNIINQGIKIGD